VRLLILFLVTTNFIFGKYFITEREYGQLLFDDPRGVSCKKCHGNFGKGRFIGKFEDENGEEKSFYGPDLSGLSLSEFKKALAKGGTIMPRYYLTEKEINAIYEFIKKGPDYEEDDNSTFGISTKKNISIEKTLNKITKGREKDSTTSEILDEEIELNKENSIIEQLINKPKKLLDDYFK
jgi:hypothetical protein